MALSRSSTLIVGFSLITGIPGPFGAKTGTFCNQVQITHQERCDWPKSHRTCLLERPGTPVLSTLSSVQVVCRILSQSEAISLFSYNHTFVPYTPYTNDIIFAFFGLCGEYSTLPTSPHQHTTTRHTDMDGHSRQIVYRTPH